MKEVRSSDLGVGSSSRQESRIKNSEFRIDFWNLEFGIWNFIKPLEKLSILSLLAVLIVTTLSCDSEEGLNCTQTAGDIQSFEVEVEPFDKVVIFERMGATFKQGPVQRVVVTTGENLFNDIDVKVIDGQLQIVNNNGCNVIRDYGITQIEITSPNLTEIRTSTGEDIKSEGVLNYPNLTLLSEDASVEEDFYNTDGDMRLELDTQNLTIVSNNLSYFYLSGTVENADITFLEGDGRIYAEDLEIQNARIFHRGTSEWRMDVKQNIAGTINGYGDVILKTRPTTVNVDVTWRGRIIYLNE
ncbi:head GIN domain-containing protein [Nonlabens agnitus]|uniref:head GIN domain-containing protein n=1 Tax=Nonlabens agnitus TaxID=870484 RepID=UPI000D02F97A|nr:head GIN domain-containing protein [Nonlabens agnitus]